jgi:hypothetical protein
MGTPPDVVGGTSPVTETPPDVVGGTSPVTGTPPDVVGGTSPVTGTPSVAVGALPVVAGTASAVAEGAGKASAEDTVKGRAWRLGGATEMPSPSRTLRAL